MGVAVRALEFGCSHIADMRLVEPHRMDNILTRALGRRPRGLWYRPATVDIRVSACLDVAPWASGEHPMGGTLAFVTPTLKFRFRWKVDGRFVAEIATNRVVS